MEQKDILFAQEHLFHVLCEHMVRSKMKCKSIFPVVQQLGTITRFLCKKPLKNTLGKLHFPDFLVPRTLFQIYTALDLDVEAVA